MTRESFVIIRETGKTQAETRTEVTLQITWNDLQFPSSKVRHCAKANDDPKTRGLPLMFVILDSKWRSLRKVQVVPRTGEKRQYKVKLL